MKSKDYQNSNTEDRVIPPNKSSKDSLMRDIKNNISPGGIGHYEEFLWNDTLQKLDYIRDHSETLKYPILIRGETGSGKTHFAKEIIHKLVYGYNSNNNPFIHVYCSAIQDTLLGSEIFGHVKGAFTSAEKTNYGYIHKANNGTLFLDEIAKISKDLQQKFLRLADDGNFNMVGSSNEETCQARLLLASNENFELLIEQDRFSPDLYHRISRITFELPSLVYRHRSIQTICKAMWDANLYNDTHPYLLFAIIQEIMKFAYSSSFDFWHCGRLLELNIINPLGGNLWELESILNEYAIKSKYDIKNAYVNVFKHFNRKIFSVNKESVRKLLDMSNHDTAETIERWKEEVEIKYYENVNKIFSKDYCWWFLKPIKKELIREWRRMKESHEKEWHPSGVTKLEAGHPSGWWDFDSFEEVKDNYCKLRVEYNKLFKGLYKQEQQANDIGISTRTLRKFLEK